MPDLSEILKRGSVLQHPVYREQLPKSVIGGDFKGHECKSLHHGAFSDSMTV